jgi:glycogen debranching enzyme
VPQIKAWLAVTFLLAACQPSDSTRPTVPHERALPTVHFARADSQALYGAAYAMALDNVFHINTVPADEAHRSSGLLTGPAPSMVRAGGGYPAAWTRDASINSWNAISLLAPDLARNTLFAVVDRDADGYIVRQDNQQWDQAIWVVAAWHHYLVTGDREFLAKAYAISLRTLATHEAKAFDATSGLFLGPSVINDGISGYPEPVADAAERQGSFVLDYPASGKVAALSTNAVHEEAYRSAGRMARALGQATQEGALNARADRLSHAIDLAFFDSRSGRYRYLFAPGMALETEASQEGLGLSFVLLFGLADDRRADAIIAQAQRAPWGIEDVTPAFRRYSDDRPGRHNNVVWPMIQGFWGSGVAAHGDVDALGVVLRQAAQLAARSGGFWEIYNARTGEVDGGWQTGHHWPSEKDQTWSATAYLRLIDEGLFGLHPDEDGLRLRPLLPAGVGAATLGGIHYRGATLSVSIDGEGGDVQECWLDDMPCPTVIPPSLKGTHHIRMTLTAGSASAGRR